MKHSSRSETKSALSSSTSSAANSANVQVEGKDKKKVASVSSSPAIGGRTKDKRKENHASNLETSDEDMQSTDGGAGE